MVKRAIPTQPDSRSLSLLPSGDYTARRHSSRVTPAQVLQDAATWGSARGGVCVCVRACVRARASQRSNCANTDRNSPLIPNRLYRNRHSHMSTCIGNNNNWVRRRNPRHDNKDVLQKFQQLNVANLAHWVCYEDKQKGLQGTWPFMSKTHLFYSGSFLFLTSAVIIKMLRMNIPSTSLLTAQYYS